MRHRLPAYAVAGLVVLFGAGALAQAEAERQLDAALERLRSALGSDATLTIGGRYVDPVTGRATLTDVTIVESENRYTIAEVRLADLSEARIGRAELINPRHSATDGSGASGQAERILLAGAPIPAAGKSPDWRSLSAEAVEVEALRIVAPGKGQIRLDRLAVRDVNPRGVGSGVIEGAEYTGTGSEPQSFRLGRMAVDAIVLPFMGDDIDPLAFRAGRVALENVSLRDPGEQVTFGLGRLSLQDWNPGRLTSLSAESIAVAAPAKHYGAMAISLGRIDASGIDAARTLAAVLGSVQLPDPAPGVPQRILLEGLDTSLDGQRVASLGRFLTEGSLRDGMVSGSLVAEGLRVVPPRGQASWLEMLGYQDIAGGIELRGTAPRAGGRLDVSPLRVAWEGAMTLSVMAQLDGMPGAPPEGSQVNPEATLAQLAAGRLAGLTLSLRDHGLLGRVIAQQARQQRVPENRIREQWAQMAMAMPLPGAGAPQGRRGGPPPAAGKGGAAADPLMSLRQAVASFVRQPGTLEITLQPPKPIGFAEIGARAGGNPAEAIELLGLSATAR